MIANQPNLCKEFHTSVDQFMATGASPAANLIRILPMDQYA
jgi:hypothetical protein